MTASLSYASTTTYMRTLLLPVTPTVVDATNPTNFRVTSGIMPVGLILDATTGEVFGTPRRVGTFTLGITCDTDSDPLTGTLALEIFPELNPKKPPRLTNPASSNGIAALRWPMIVAPDGRFAVCADVSEGWAQRVKAVITTRLPERVMRSDYGCGVTDMLLGISDVRDATTLIRQAMSTWLPALEISDIRVTGGGSPEMVIELDYRTPGGDVETVLASFRTPVEEPSNG